MKRKNSNNPGRGGAVLFHPGEQKGRGITASIKRIRGVREKENTANFYIPFGGGGEKSKAPAPICCSSECCPGRKGKKVTWTATLSVCDRGRRNMGDDCLTPPVKPEGKSSELMQPPRPFGGISTGLTRKKGQGGKKKGGWGGSLCHWAALVQTNVGRGEKKGGKCRALNLSRIRHIGLGGKKKKTGKSSDHVCAPGTITKIGKRGGQDA